MKLAALVGQLPHAADHRGCTGAALRGGIGIQTLVGVQSPHGHQLPACTARWGSGCLELLVNPGPGREEGRGHCSAGITTGKLGRVSLLLLYQVWGQFG